jgi:hypothetical protein
LTTRKHEIDPRRDKDARIDAMSPGFSKTVNDRGRRAAL